MDAAEEIGQRVAAVMKALYDEIPARLGINAFLADAYHRLMVATDGMDAEARRMMVNNGVAEALREIATYAVEQFTKRTGDPFQWADEPEQPADDAPLMTFAVDAKGNVVF